MGFSAGTLEGAGGILKGVSQISSGDTKANLERANAAIADQQAKSEIASGAYNANLAREKSRQVTGAQVAGIGANNLQQGGTPALVVANTARAGEEDALMVQNNALRRAWGFEVQGASDRFQASQDKLGGMLSGLGSFVSAGATIAGM